MRVRQSISKRLIQCIPLLFAAPAIGDSGHAPVTLTVSAATSLTDAFEELRARFIERHPRVGVDLNFGGSNHLQRQIEAVAGRGVDVFAPAGKGPMDALIEAGYVNASDRRSLAGNRLVLIVPPDNPVGIQSFDDLTREDVLRLAVGADKVPVGRYARQTLRHLGLLQRLAPKLVQGIHTRQVADYVARGEVDAGLVYATDAAEMGGRVSVAARAESAWHEPIIYPIAVLRLTAHRTEAEQFVQFVTAAEGRAILMAHGFAEPPPIDGGDRIAGTTESPVPSGAWTAMKLSLIAGSAALLVVFPLGTALGALLAKRRFPGREVLDAVLTLPMILPPTVTGYYLIIVLGAGSPIGRSLESWFGVRVALTLLGASVASAIIALPLMVKSARAAFESVDREFELASYALGKGRIETLLRVTLPLARNGLIAGAILSFARAIGEFGATFMLAGIIPGRTMTMPVAIFHAFTNHQDRTARTLVLMLTAFSVAVIYATNRLASGQLKRVRD